jgi:hypothetical protein
MATKPEAAFYDWIKSNIPWFFQRIETTTGSGIPDIWSAHQGESLWIELKALPATNLQIRKAQYAWMTKAHWNGIHTWIWNRNPRRKTVIQAWVTPFEVEPGKKDHLKITSQPRYALSPENFRDLDIRKFTRTF